MPRTPEEWIEQYGHSHTNPVNRLLHTIGIPMIALSIPLFVVSLFVEGFWKVPAFLFVAGWIFRFVGHAFEGCCPSPTTSPARFPLRL